MRIINAIFLLDFNENVRGDHPPLNIWCVLSYSLRKFHHNICRKAKKIPFGGGVPLWGYFFLCGQSSLHVEAIFSVCSGYFCSCPPPLTIFCGSPYNCCHIFFTALIYFFSHIVWRFQFFEGTFFPFSRGGGGLREGGRLLSTLDCFCCCCCLPQSVHLFSPGFLGLKSLTP